MKLNRTIIADVIDGLRTLPDKSIHCCVTSPPYWNLREYRENGKRLPDSVWGGDPRCGHEWITLTKTKSSGAKTGSKLEGGKTNQCESATHDNIISNFCSKCGAWRGQLGLEPTPEMYVEHMVSVFREVWRVLRDDGSLWLNIGDSYASGKGTCFNPGGGALSLGKEKKSEGAHPLDRGNKSDLEAAGLKPKDLCMIPARVALALQADGWWLRSDIIWAKGISFLPDYAGSCMPESCTDRPTTGHEHIFLLTKKDKYFYDAVAVQEKSVKGSAGSRYNTGKTAEHGLGRSQKGKRKPDNGTRNLRSVWAISPRGYKEHHYATFPEKIPSVCIRAGTSEWGCCPTCGANWIRVVDKIGGTIGKGWHPHKNDIARGQNITAEQLKKQKDGSYQTKTTGFRPSCDCPDNKPVPCIILDPFMGSGTTGKVAQDLHRDWIGIDLGYKELSDKRTQQPSLM